MVSGRVGIGAWAMLLLASVLMSPGLASAAGTERAKPKPADQINTAKKPSNPMQDRAQAVAALSSMNTAQEVRDFRVVEALLEIAQNKKDDIFVRIATIEGLGTLQYSLFQTDDYAKNRFIEPFSGIIKDKGEDELVRQSIAANFQKTLKSTGLKDKEAFETLSKIAEDKTEALLVRIACIDFIGEFGSDKGIGVLVGILSQIELDKQVREAVVRALAKLLAAIDDVKDVNFPAINKIKEIVTDKNMAIEIRASSLTALAQLKLKGAKGVDDSVMEVIKQVLKTENDSIMVIAAIDALGIVGDEKALDDLKKAYGDFFDAKKPDRSADVKIRVAIMKVLGNMLAQQNQKSAPNAESIKKCVELLTKGIDIQAKPPEVGEVTAAAIYSLRYLYPKKPAFQGVQKDVIDKLILIIKPTVNAAREYDEAVIDTLKAITRQPFGKDPARWDKWYDETYGIKVKP